jgi:hypothetical protein
MSREQPLAGGARSGRCHAVVRMSRPMVGAVEAPRAPRVDESQALENAIAR